MRGLLGCWDTYGYIWIHHNYYTINHNGYIWIHMGYWDYLLHNFIIGIHHNHTINY